MDTVELTSPRILITYPQTKYDLAMMGLTAEYPKALIALNAQKLVGLVEDPNFLGSISGPIYYPDGASILWFAKEQKTKVPGVELWFDVLDLAIKKQRRVAIIGGSKEVSQISESKILNEYPNAKLAMINGYESYSHYTQFMAEHRPNICFIAMGTPKQEKLISNLQIEYSTCLYMGIGGSLDIFTGQLKRAPKIWRDLNLEFLYRLLIEPKRIWGQRKLFTFLYYYMTKKFFKNLD